MDIKDLADLLVNRLDKLDEKVEDARTTLAGQARDIAHHIRRTDALETRVEQVSAELVPVRDSISRAKGALALVGGLATLAGLILGVLKIALG